MMTKTTAAKDESALVPATEADRTFAMIQSAIDKGVEADTLEKMLNMQERVMDRNAAQAYAAAMTRFQAKCPPIMKGTRGHHGMFADYETIMRTIGPVLADNGLSVTFDSRTECDAGSICIDCVVTHEYGHSTRVHVPPFQDDKSGGKQAIQVGHWWMV